MLILKQLTWEHSIQALEVEWPVSELLLAIIINYYYVPGDLKQSPFSLPYHGKVVVIIFILQLRKNGIELFVQGDTMSKGRRQGELNSNSGLLMHSR